MQWILLVLPLLVLVFALLQQDVPLSPEAELLLSSVTYAAEEEPYLYLIGIQTSTEDPIGAGREILTTDAYRDDADTLHKHVPIPQSPLLCDYSDEKCRETLFSSNPDLKAFLKEHQIFIDRTQQFLSWNTYRTLTEPSFEERQPEYVFVRTGARLLMLSALQESRESPAKAINDLRAVTQLFRKQLAIEDNLIGKLVYAKILSELINMQSLLIAEFTPDITGLSIERLSISERSLRKPFAREFLMYRTMLVELDGHPNFFSMENNAWEWQVELVFKPNMTTNIYADSVMNLIRASESPVEQWMYIAEKSQTFDPALAIRNPAGTLLVNTALNNPLYYLSQIGNLDARIVLFNHRLSGRSDSAKNPFWTNEFSFTDDKSVCFHTPFQNDQANVCLSTAW